MPAIQRISDRHALADLVVFDRQDRPVLIVAAEGGKIQPRYLESYREVLQSIRRNIPFAILADSEEIAVYRKERTWRLVHLASIPTREVLLAYDPVPDRGRISKDLLAGMIAAWIRDLAIHWKLPTPPASETMVALGLTGRLDGGCWMKRGVRLACLPLRGDELPHELRDGAEPGGRGNPPEVTPGRPADRA